MFSYPILSNLVIVSSSFPGDETTINFCVGFINNPTYDAKVVEKDIFMAPSIPPSLRSSLESMIIVSSNSSFTS